MPSGQCSILLFIKRALLMKDGRALLLAGRVRASTHQQLLQTCLVEDRNAQLFSAGALRARLGPRDHVVRLRRNGATDLSSQGSELLPGLLAGVTGESSRQHDG